MGDCYVTEMQNSFLLVHVNRVVTGQGKKLSKVWEQSRNYILSQEKFLKKSQGKLK